MPGWVVSSEALHRSSHLHPHCNSFAEVEAPALLVWESITNLKQDVTKCCNFSPHISLAATVRKLLYTFAQGVELENMHGRPVSQSEEVWGQNRDSGDVSQIVSVCIKAAFKLDTCIDTFSVGGSGKNCSSCSGGSSSNVITSTSAADMVEGCFSRGVDIASSESHLDHTSQRNTAGCTSVCSATSTTSRPVHYGNKGQADNSKELAQTQFNRQQLQTILLCTVVQVCLWARRCKLMDHVLSDFSYPVWFHYLMQSHPVSNPHLKGVVMSLLIDSSKATATSHYECSVAWERYAVSNLKGRLLPGCCNLACANLTGVSEASLKTLLCSGCRRARYCSVECQKSAWLHGGHRDVCAR